MKLHPLAIIDPEFFTELATSYPEALAVVMAEYFTDHMKRERKPSKSEIRAKAYRNARTIYARTIARGRSVADANKIVDEYLVSKLG